jgi:hypothetical protein
MRRFKSINLMVLWGGRGNAGIFLGITGAGRDTFAKEDSWEIKSV